MDQHLVSKQADQRIVKANGLHFHVAAAGPPDGPLVMLLHGFPESSHAWRRQLKPLASAGFRAVAVDQRGYGGSSRPSGVAAYSTDLLCADVISVARSLGRERFDVVGHDWGGVVAWHLATWHAEVVNRAVIINAPHPSTLMPHVLYSPSQALKSSYIALFQLPWIAEALLRAGDFALLKHALTATSRRGTFGRDDLQTYRDAWSQPGALTSMLNWYRAMPLAKSLTARRVTVPVRMIWGDRDTSLNASLAEEGLAMCDRAEVFHISDATHWVHHERPERVSELLIEFLH